MPLAVRCPNPACAASCTVAGSADGPIRCPKCGKQFLIRLTSSASTSDAEGTVPPGDPFQSLPATFGRYRVVRLLGRGGMGAVYLAEDTRLGRQVALKLPSFAAGDARRRERFVREGRAAAALHHPNVCTVFDADEIGERPFLTMAFVAGRSLAAEIDGPMEQRRAAEIARKVALGLAHAHGKGIVHRDVKPANMMLTAEGEPVVTDFGLAKQAEAAGAKLTRVGGVIGTPSYLAPEQVRGEEAGPAVDVYALGVVLFEMLTGRVPYSGGGHAVLGQILLAPVPPVKEFREDVDPRLESICQKAMAKDAAAWFASMTDFAAALGEYLAADSVAATLTLQPAAPPPSAPSKRSPAQATTALFTPVPPPRSGHIVRLIALALAALVATAALLIVLIAFVFLPRRPTVVLVIQVSVPTPEVFVDGERAEVKWDKDGRRGEVRVRPGQRRVVVRKDGETLLDEEVTAEEGNRRVVEAKADAGGPIVPDGKEFTNSIGMRLVRIPKGEFRMGAAGPGNHKPETPQHPVKISRDYYIGVTEVTQGQWKKVMGFNPSYYSAEGTKKEGRTYGNHFPAAGREQVKDFTQEQLDEFPVENLGWDDIQEFLEKLSAREKGCRYELPSEAEWEYACRAPISPISSVRTCYRSRPTSRSLA